VGHSVPESSLVEQFEAGADLARKRALSSADENRIEKEMTLVDQVGSKRKRCELGPRVM
jgi:hypothetical protein